MKYRKKPVVIDAYQYTGKNGFLIQQWSIGAVNAMENPEGFLEIETLEGLMVARTGDYIIKGVQGEFYPCKPDIFEATYERVEND
jgi:hypothetical protein